MAYNNRDDILKAIRNKKVEGLNLSGADLTRADLSNANLFDTDLSGADLVGTNLTGSDLTGANLSGADLTRADLTGARLWHADLTGAKLVESNLSGVDFWQAKLPGARLWRADLTGAKALTKQNFMFKKNRIKSSCSIYEVGHIAAEETYRTLKRYFISEGRYNDASWASFKEKKMETAILRKNREITYIPVALMGILCGYGEKPQRIISSSFLIIFAYAILYNLLNLARQSIANEHVLNFGDYIYFSVVTFTTLGYGDIVPRFSTFYRLLAVSEAFLGAFMMGLFIFTLARKYSAR